MNTTDKEFKKRIKKLPKVLQDSIESALDTMVPEYDLLDDDFLASLKELSLETYHLIKKGKEKIKNEPQDEISVKIINLQTEEFDFSNTHNEDVIFYHGSYETSKDIALNSQIIIFDGDLTCNHMIVNDSYLFVNGKISCNILFGASGNDKMTHVTSKVNAKAVVENGHFTLVEDDINANAIVEIHNEVKSNKKINSSVVFIRNQKNNVVLNKNILNDDGYFDEEKFINFIKSENNIKLFE